MPETLTIRVDPGVHQAILSIANGFGWTTSDVASTLLWISLFQIDQRLIPEETKKLMFADMLEILGKFGSMAVLDPKKAKDNLRKTMLLLQKPERQTSDR